MYLYSVCCSFVGEDQAVVDEWLDWLKSGHIQDVIDGGADGADIVKMDGDGPTFEIRYQFGSQELFDQYEREHAPRLREEGLKLFPLERGLEYSRTTGTVVFSL